MGSRDSVKLVGATVFARRVVEAGRFTQHAADSFARAFEGVAGKTVEAHTAAMVVLTAMKEFADATPAGEHVRRAVWQDLYDSKDHFADWLAAGADGAKVIKEHFLVVESQIQKDDSSEPDPPFGL